MYRTSEGTFFTERVLLLILTVILQSSICVQDIQIVTQPADVSVREGETASFTFTVISNLSFLGVSSYWEMNTKPIFTSDMYNVSTISCNDTNRVSSHLTIHRVQRDMNRLYRCWIMITVADNAPIAHSSEFANLEVLYFLKDNELVCRGPSGFHLQEYDQVTIECLGTQSNPQAKLILLQYFDVSPSGFKQTGSLLIGNITATPWLHKKSLICVAESEAFPGDQVSCSLGPYTVVHTPVIEVIPYQAEIAWPLVTELTFQCVATGYPEVYMYNWSCHPEEMFSQCSSSTRNISIILKDIKKGEIANITCMATNEIAASRNNSIIHVRYTADQLLAVCMSNSTYLPLMTENGFPMLYYDDTLDAYKCLVEVHGINDEVIFQWFLDGRPVFENGGKHDLVISSDGYTHLIVYNTIRAQGPSIIACNIRHPTSHRFSFKKLVACTLVSAVTDPTIIVTDSLQEITDLVVFNQDEHSMKFMTVVYISVGCGMLFSLSFVIIMIIAWRKSVFKKAEGTPSGKEVSLTNIKSICSNVSRLASVDNNEIPVYEIPDVDLNRHTSIESESSFRQFDTVNRQLSFTSYMETEEDEGETEGISRKGESCWIGRLGPQRNSTDRGGEREGSTYDSTSASYSSSEN